MAFGWAHAHFADEALCWLRHQNGDHAGNILRLQHAAAVLGPRPKAGVHGTRRHNGHADVVCAQLLGGRVGEAIQRPLGGGIGCPVGERTLAGERRDIYDEAAAASDHPGNQRSHQQKGRAHIRRKDRIEDLRIGLMQRAAHAADPGCVDQDVAAAARERIRDVGDGVPRCEIAGDHVCGTALGTDLMLDRCEGVLIASQEQNTSTE
jgi:hypothetical protein